VDIRVKSFAPEAAGRLDFLCGSVRRTQIGSGAAHTGYQLRRALDRQAEAVRSVLRDESSPHS
jgi:hypothetical protein